MSQQVFADRLGKSKSWVDKVERGVRRLDKFSAVHEIADVLQVDVQILLGREPERRSDGVNGVNGVDQVEVEEIRAALERYDQVSPFFTAPSEPPSLEQLRKAVNHAWQTDQHAKREMLARALPKLLRDAQTADAAYATTDDAIEAANLLAQAYQLTSSTLRKLGEHQLSWLAGDRAIAVAQRAADPLLTGIATYRAALALLALGRSRPALEANVNIANRLAPGSGSEPATPERLSVYGMMLLQGAFAAARIGDAASARDLLAGADEAARALGGDHNYYWTSFGPTNVQLHRAACAVELGEGRLAVETHEQIDPRGFGALLPERRVHHYLDIARGFAQVGNIQSASEMLLMGDRLAPSELRCRPIARELLGDLLRRSQGALPPSVVELAEAVGADA
jgi:transcriptional regulator with XRE-family HTH domain